AVDQLRKLNDLVLPVTKAEADQITEKAMTDLRTVRRNALAALGTEVGMSATDADAYVRATDPLLEGQSFAPDVGVLLAPAVHAELEQDVLDVLLDGLPGDYEVARDVDVIHPACEKSQDLELPPSQPGDDRASYWT